MASNRQNERTICIVIVLVCLALSWPTITSGSQGASSDALNAAEQAATQISNQISNIEWLAPLAPIALSPFFGITLLSGLACYGPEWLPENALLSPTSPFANPWIFWTFLGLTIVTSLPRLSKVSKPIAQCADFLETYAAIIILVAMKVASMTRQPVVTDVVTNEAGILSVGLDGLLIMAIVINVIVVNSVKFFFEFLIWITPVPFLAACFEVANKSLCLGLIAVYAISPIAALILNIVIFAVCLLVFRWVWRRQIFYRYMVSDWILGWFDRSRGVPRKGALVVFPRQDVNNIKALSKCRLSRVDSGWNLVYNRLLRPPLTVELFESSGPVIVHKGWWTNSLEFGDGKLMTFSSRYRQNLEALCELIDARLDAADERPSNLQTARQVDFA